MKITRTELLRRCWRWWRTRFHGVSGNGTSATSEFRLIELGPAIEASESPYPRNRITSNKYTVWNFIPKNLFEQFRRVGNFYFLVTAIIAMSIQSPISPLTSSLPLLFVILVTACKQGYEDLLRYRSDRSFNNLPVTVVRRKCSQDIPCQQIVVGDIVRVNRDDDVPCDLVILHSSELSGKCYVTTSNLDGETNLKTLQVPKIFSDLDLSQIVSMKGTITCQPPMAALYTFEGRAQVSFRLGEETSERSGPLGINNVALRGARLKDTDYIYGCAVYTGRDTKLSLNSKLSVNKFSTAEKSINKYLLVFMVFLLTEVCFCTIMKIIIEISSKWDIYLGQVNTALFSNLLNDFLSFIILFNYVVPISLYVTIELQKFWGSFFFSWDLKMYDAASNQPAIINTSDLNEDLGQVEYLFSDKTGTLTENLMIFRRCFIDGHAYIEKDCDGNLYLLPSNGNEADAQSISSWTPSIWHFMLGISLCHTVHIAPPIQKAKAQLRRMEFRESFRLKKIIRVNSSLMMDPSLPEYQAASTDEKALVEASARCGVVYHGERDTNQIEVNAKGRILQYQRLDTFEFTSNRKRMSVILKDTAGDVWLYCKGADSSIFPLIRHERLELAKDYVVDFSMRGLRTLVIGFKKLKEEEFVRLQHDVNQARQVIGQDREKSVDNAYTKYENGLTLLGATAVEDRLQERVPEIMEKLQAAGIKIWILTGDKAETAENIAFFCGHFKKGTKVLRLMNQDWAQLCYITLTSFERKMKIKPYVQYGLIMDGISMGVALKNCPSLLRNIAMACDAVVCCRMSPLQKSEMVQLVKRARSSPLTAAIGDGGNDVSMIQEAHVGIGIVGKEGRQATMSADFAFAKFMHLERALLVHGHWYYRRVSVLTQYFFYKNVVFITPQLFFSLYSGFSAQGLYDSIFFMCFNIFFSSVPILIYGISDQKYSDAKLLKHPQLYKLHQKNYLISSEQFLKWMFIAIWQTSAIYFVPHYFWIYNPVIMYDGTAADHWCFGTCIFHLVVAIINLQVLVESSYWTFPFLSSIFLTEMFFLTVSFTYSFLNFQYDGNMLSVFPKLLFSGAFWLLTLLVIVICMIPVLLIAVYETNRPIRIRGKLESREEGINEIIYSPIEPASPILPNRRSSSVVSWRGNLSIYDNKAFRRASIDEIYRIRINSVF